MKQTNQIGIFLLVALFLAAFSSPVLAQKTTSKSGDANSTTTSSGASMTQDISTTMSEFAEKWQEACNGGDREALKAMYDEKVVVVAPDGTSKTISRDEVIHNLENDFIDPGVDISLHAGNAFELPDGNVRIVGSYEVEVKDPKSGEMVKQTGIYDNRVKKVNNNWVLTQTSVVPIR
ncbi:MAG: nuclear transport factor 2 family protein [Saprospiraceae bacterium]|nr:nuclear transport factor 2 family protein [Saprospiraceae bacterium]MCB9343259.1 nuclear transport factor 2 family protein [Lewinellaceae bacterium]